MSGGDGYTIQAFGAMIRDRLRTDPYVEALRRAIGPECVVLDIGTGTGIFAILACMFGARRVYAVEPDDSIEVAKMCAEHNIHCDRIVWMQAASTEIDLPERVDVIIGDLRGTLPLHRANISSFIDARRRHLKPGGRLIPMRDVLHAVPAQAPAEYESIEIPWERNEYGVNLSAGKRFVANSLRRARPEPVLSGNFLSSPAKWGEIDYARVESPNLDGEMRWRVERPGTLHGFYVWFNGDLGDGIGFSNAPNLPELIYGRLFFPLLNAIDVLEGDAITTRMTATRVNGEYVFRWKTRIVTRSGTLKGAFDQSTFASHPLNPLKLRLADSGYTPTLSLDGQIDHAILDAMSQPQAQPIGEIARDVAARFPRRFVDHKAAFEHVSKLSVRYCDSSRSAAMDSCRSSGRVHEDTSP